MKKREGQWTEGLINIEKLFEWKYWNKETEKTGNDKSEIFEIKIIESGELLVMTTVVGV